MFRDQAATDAAGVLVGKTAAYGGGASAFVFGLSANEVAALGGLLVATIGLCVQWYYNHRRDKREQVESAERRARYKADP
jgi:hypothetical protein